MSPDRTGGPVDLIHVATISRGQNRVPCRFIMNKNPAAYALIYQTKAKKDLAYTRLQDLEGFTERNCGETHDFPDASFIDTELYEAAWDIRTEMRSEGCMSYCTDIEDYGETKPKDWDWDRFDLGPFSTIRSLQFTILRDKERPNESDDTPSANTRGRNPPVNASDTRKDEEMREAQDANSNPMSSDGDLYIATDSDSDSERSRLKINTKYLKEGSGESGGFTRHIKEFSGESAAVPQTSEQIKSERLIKSTFIFLLHSLCLKLGNLDLQ